MVWQNKAYGIKEYIVTPEMSKFSLNQLVRVLMQKIENASKATTEIKSWKNKEKLLQNSMYRYLNRQDNLNFAFHK